MKETPVAANPIAARRHCLRGSEGTRLTATLGHHGLELGREALGGDRLADDVALGKVSELVRA